jgi:hypothetical protein
VDAAPGIVDIGSRLELFVDRHLIGRMEGVDLRLHHPQPREKVLAFDRPWEGASSAYATVFQDEGRFCLYYRGSPWGGEPQVTCYAESDDGVNWARPSLGLYEFNGTRDNNIVWTGEGSHNLAPFRDANPGAPPSQRFKALGGKPPLAFASPDGVRWEKLLPEPVLTQGAFDSQNVAFWDTARGCYAAYYRAYRGGGRSGERTVARSTSADFLHWSGPELIDLGAAPPEHLYTNATLPYPRAPHLLLAFPMRFLPNRQVVRDSALPGVSDAVLMSSRDGVRFQRTFLEAFVRPGRDRRNWTDRSNMVAWGLLPTAPDELSLYVSRHYRHSTAHLQRFAIRVDGFASVRAPYQGGRLTTVPLTFAGSELILNYATSAAGGIRIELQEPDGRPTPGFSLSESLEMVGDEIEGVAAWTSSADLGALAGRPVRLCFVMHDADLYSLRFRQGDRP